MASPLISGASAAIRFAVLGGIYGRPVVVANLTLHFISALVLLRAAQRAGFPAALCLLAAPATEMAGAYGWRLLRGPAANDLRPRAGR